MINTIYLLLGITPDLWRVMSHDGLTCRYYKKCPNHPAAVPVYNYNHLFDALPKIFSILSKKGVKIKIDKNYSFHKNLIRQINTLIQTDKGVKNIVKNQISRQRAIMHSTLMYPILHFLVKIIKSMPFVH